MNFWKDGMIQNKSPNLNIYEYMDQFYVRYGNNNNETEVVRKEKRLKRRKAVKSRNINFQFRRTSPRSPALPPSPASNFFDVYFF